MSKKNRIRLFCREPLACGKEYIASESQAHYLLDVMRLRLGDEVFLFDGINGEFLSTLEKTNKKVAVLKVVKKVFDFEKSPDLWLLFAPLKKENTNIFCSTFHLNCHLKLEEEWPQ